MMFLRFHFVAVNILIIYWNIEAAVAMDGCKYNFQWKCGDQCIDYTVGTCTCGETDNNTKTFRHDEGYWCCSSQNKCEITKGIKRRAKEAKCHGKVLTLEEQCNVEGKFKCNHYPSDPRRNLYAPRSFLNLCQDNRYVFPI
jgi:hypothetical protein